MKWSKASRITAVVCGTVFAVAVLAASVLSGATLDAAKIFEIIGTAVAGVLAGMGIAAGPSRHIPLIAALCMAFSLTACSGAQDGPKINPCDAQQAVVSALDLGVRSLDGVPGTDSPDWDNAKKIAGGIVSLGHAATQGCRLSRDDTGWQSWVQLAFEVTTSIVMQFVGAYDPALPNRPPEALRKAYLILGAEISIPPVEREYPEPEKTKSPSPDFI